MASLALAGCGGETSSSSGGSNSCPSGSPCGGDLVGSWSAQEGCFEDFTAVVFDQPECRDAVRSLDVLTLDGAYAFRSDGTMDLSMDISYESVFDLDSACIGALGGPSPTSSYCSSLGSRMNDGFQADPASTLESARCSFASGGCRCTFDSKVQHHDSTGPYTVDGSTLTDSDGDTSDYCVDGSRLWMRSSAPEGTFIAVLTKQP